MGACHVTRSGLLKGGRETPFYNDNNIIPPKSMSLFRHFSESLMNAGRLMRMLITRRGGSVFQSMLNSSRYTGVIRHDNDMET